ncbi:flagellar hook assembly protein FlgD [Bacillus suaedaesalsae]|uniref:Flagellar hook assembly protein FlgD n=1 Tax=Bacillus suaedaesalsae TaxID=2810349 RepID=A0ABS2DIW6_9BACI|nr:flagellar hook assembly protein FlgD [Bacillus suaedaesalsae]MBM6618441.1 flagellar hook assembly protein FlgD [Bacillus suaedaesalsae]
MTVKMDPSLYLQNQTVERKAKGDALGKDDFLKILMTQLQNQDPMNPMQDKDFIAQMATFTSLEQMTNMNKMLETFINSQTADGILKYSEMIGKEVQYNSVSIGENGEQNVTNISGIVKSVQQKGTQTFIELQDGTTIPTSSITKVSNPAPEL